MTSVWKLAFELLSDADKIVFIGYSLPETDIYVKYLLITSLKESYNLKDIEVVCSDENNSVENRYCKFFDENFRSKSFTFHSQKFEDWFKEKKR